MNLGDWTISLILYPNQIIRYELQIGFATPESSEIIQNAFPLDLVGETRLYYIPTNYQINHMYDMLRERTNPDSLSEFLRYLAQHEETNGQTVTSADRDSVAIWESVWPHCANNWKWHAHLDLVEVRPRTGNETPALFLYTCSTPKSSLCPILNNEYFRKFSELRKHIESAYWYEAVAVAHRSMISKNCSHCWRAQKKNCTVIQFKSPTKNIENCILVIYQRLNNPFVTGLLEAYWEAYEAVGFNVFTGDLSYLEEVWRYHHTNG